MVISFTGRVGDLRITGLKMVPVLSYTCQVRAAFEISMGEMFSRAIEYVSLIFRDGIG